jgi:hypothetical protein
MLPIDLHMGAPAPITPEKRKAMSAGFQRWMEARNVAA